MTSYTTWGSVTGACGHRHRSIETAAACRRAHGHQCARQGGYSDRDVRALEPDDLDTGYNTLYGPGRELTDAEVDRLYAADLGPTHA